MRREGMRRVWVHSWLLQVRGIKHRALLQGKISPQACNWIRRPESHFSLVTQEQRRLSAESTNYHKIGTILNIETGETLLKPVFFFKIKMDIKNYGSIEVRYAVGNNYGNAT